MIIMNEKITNKLNRMWKEMKQVNQTHQRNKHIYKQLTPQHYKHQNIHSIEYHRSQLQQSNLNQTNPYKQQLEKQQNINNKLKKQLTQTKCFYKQLEQQYKITNINRGSKFNQNFQNKNIKNVNPINLQQVTYNSNNIPHSMQTNNNQMTSPLFITKLSSYNKLQQDIQRLIHLLRNTFQYKQFVIENEGIAQMIFLKTVMKTRRKIFTYNQSKLEGQIWFPKQIYYYLQMELKLGKQQLEQIIYNLNRMYLNLQEKKIKKLKKKHQYQIKQLKIQLNKNLPFQFLEVVKKRKEILAESKNNYKKKY